MLTFAPDNREKVWYNGRKFGGIKEIGFNEAGKFVVKLFPCSPDPRGRGSFLTVFAISPKSYRENHPTKTAWFRLQNVLEIYDDYGNKEVLKFSKSAWVDKLAEELKQQEIPQALI